MSIFCSGTVWGVTERSLGVSRDCLKQKNKQETRLLHRCPIRDFVPYNLHLKLQFPVDPLIIKNKQTKKYSNSKHSWNKATNEKQLNAFEPWVCRITEVSGHDFISALISKYANPGIFLLSNLPNKRWWRAASASSGASQSKRKLGYFEMSPPLSSFLLKYIFFKSGEGGCNLLLQVRLSSSSPEMIRTPTGSSHLSAFFHSALNEPLACG